MKCEYLRGLIEMLKPIYIKYVYPESVEAKYFQEICDCYDLLTRYLSLIKSYNPQYLHISHIYNRLNNVKNIVSNIFVEKKDDFPFRSIKNNISCTIEEIITNNIVFCRIEDQDFFKMNIAYLFGLLELFLPNYINILTPDDDTKLQQLDELRGLHDLLLLFLTDKICKREFYTSMMKYKNMNTLITNIFEEEHNVFPFSHVPNNLSSTFQQVYSVCVS